MFFCKNTYILIRENTPPHFNICLTFKMISGVHFNFFSGFCVARELPFNVLT